VALAALGVGTAFGVAALVREAREARPQSGAAPAEGGPATSQPGPAVRLVPLDGPGDAVSPAPPERYLFTPFVDQGRLPAASLQPGSVKLASLFPRTERLWVTALRSTEGTAAVVVVEESIDRPWGELLIPAERRIFRSFARDRSLGDWLIVVSDVVVLGERDPVPLTAYRWSRDDVEAYAACGISERDLDDCAVAFFRAAHVLMSGLMGFQPSQ
jgi:hypothetical protein